MHDEKIPINSLFENGHFYSPVVNPTDIEARRNEIWNWPQGAAGIDFNREAQLDLLEHVFPKHLPNFNYPKAAADAVDDQGRQGYFLDNDQFSNLDAVCLFVMLCDVQPKRVIEIGSGFSSLLMADVRRRFLAPEAVIQCIEPYPREFLRDSSHGLELVQSQVQHVPLNFFQTLSPGDILFIDSSHVSKTGSDVNYLMFQVLPRLPTGVYVHIHDIFLPNDYPYKWVVEENRSWNEQYVVQAYLMFNPKVRVVFGSSYANSVLPEQTAQALKIARIPPFGGSLWLQTC